MFPRNGRLHGRGALQLGVRSGQRESRELQVIEVRAEPRIHTVTLLALCRKSCLYVVGRGCRLIRLCMAGITIRRQPDELSGCGALVT